ncbi:MAG: hypothetical protein O3C67_08985 [Cyanobacteria bacterium]|nr:hypothetical protein [Cyanobacteriota bacterium]MEB3268775.1 hypothetical protein [Leptolyngbya sp.]
MNSYTARTLLDQQRQRLENCLRQSDQSINNGLNPLPVILQQWGQQMVAWLTQGDQPRIHRQQRGDVQVWRVYDPVDNQTRYFTEEAEVRTWLEQRFHG